MPRIGILHGEHRDDKQLALSSTAALEVMLAFRSGTAESRSYHWICRLEIQPQMHY